MAAVEKRRNPFVSLLGNHLMFAIIALFIAVPLKGNGAGVFFGVFFLLLYLLGIYDYANRGAILHKKPYSTVSPSYKRPAVYGLAAVIYFLFPLVLFETVKFFAAAYGELILFIFIFDGQFVFSDLITVTENSTNINWITAAVFCAILFAVSFLGYFAGIKGFSLAAKLSKYLYKKPNKK